MPEPWIPLIPVVELSIKLVSACGMGKGWTSFAITNSVCMRKSRVCKLDNDFLSFHNNLQMKFENT